MDNAPFFLGFVGTFKLINFDESTPIGNVAQLLLVVIDFVVLHYMYEFIEDKSAIAYQIWFYLFLALIITYKPVRYRIFDSNNHEVEYSVIFYGCLYAVAVVLIFVVIFVTFAAPPAELIIALLGMILSAIITLVFLSFEKKS